ncbi:AMP-binding enzyme family protein (macronuclear) [Tetrahymena thermophila SB210]|uniref:AMP-binding enzyme family protein n=1 Tax=Tetrahymena thermophila (strain SB210) TaxID=312017 RepID=Q237B6_TETTS|nr:AMP-binding enzyme family protein [Tetrahymena thermophila SB210]EAR92334.3 AMP-binding enzyme family protein [Tetrahymena thermophila SB210]|eukprot:XP_001012579.3 AMP-binding enzyme family protein [Tetrahymena thermophila SB210]
MNFSKLDIFSTQFNFNLGNLNSRKGTFIGTLLTLFIVITALTYLIYILQQYFNNLIEPNFRSQNVISSQLVDIGLTNDILGFRFEYDLNKSIDPLQVKQNLTYIVYMAVFEIYDGNRQQFIQLDIKKCENEQLNEFNCVDFSQLQNNVLFSNYQSNAYSSIQIYMYGCQDLDNIKTTIPNNCASQDQIDQIINGYYAGQRIMLLTSQYDVSSKSIMANYRSIFVYSIANQYVLTTVKVQKQISKIKQGFLLQSEEIFSSPIQYGIYNQNFDKQYCIQTSGLGPYNQFNIVMDEVQQQIKIQYQTIPQVLAMVNSTFTLLMFLGVIGRYLAKKSIMQDLFMLFLRNMYQDSYSQILKFNSYFQSNQDFEFYLNFMETKSKFIEEKEESQSIVVPSLMLKTKQKLDQKKQSLINYENIYSSQIGDQDKTMNYNSSFKFLSKLCTVSHDQKEYSLDDRQVNIFNSFKQQIKDCSSKIDQSVSSESSPNQMIKRQIKTPVTNKSQQKQRFSFKSVRQFESPVIEQSNKLSNIDLNKSVFEYYSQKLKTIYNSSISLKIQKMIFKTRFCRRKKELNKIGLSHQMYKTIEDEVNKNIDIFQINQLLYNLLDALRSI